MSRRTAFLGLGLGCVACVITLAACSAADENLGDVRGGSGTGATAGSGGNNFVIPEGSGCASANVQAARVTPTIWLVIDGSGSMSDSFGDSDRWSELRDALMNPAGGVVPTLQGAVVFGQVLYDGPLDIGGLLGPIGDLFGWDAGSAGVCPRLVVTEPALDNFATMDGMYPAEPLGGSTPTHRALDAVLGRLTPVGPDTTTPTYVVLATDGSPNDLCGTSAEDSSQAVLTATQKIAATGTKTFVISLAGDDAELQEHLAMVAEVGGTGKAPFTPMTKNELVQTFQEIIGGAVGCEIRLNGKVTAGSECLGYVGVNGVQLPCNDPNGWRLKDEQTLELTGSACDSFRTNSAAQLRADFPCEVFAPD